jgi:hypothetical protein
LLAETANDLQSQLDAFYEYCNLWKLKVNADKTNVMVLGCFFVKLKFPVLVKIIPR